MPPLRHTLLVISTFIAFGASSVSAQAVIVVGARPCGTWVKDRNQPDGWGATTNTAWLMGYLSGLAAATRNDFLRGSNVDSIALWVDNYCHANPLKDLDDAAVELAVELTRKRRNQ